MEHKRSLWEILKEDYHFKQHKFHIPTSVYQAFKDQFFPAFWKRWFPVKTSEQFSDDWLSANINGNIYDIFMVDMWYVQVRKNGKVIFDKRKFKNEELLLLLV